jgi:hypothetical protein
MATVARRHARWFRTGRAARPAAAHWSDKSYRKVRLQPIGRGERRLDTASSSLELTMNLLPVLMKFHAGLSPAHLRLALCAAILAVSLLWLYVHTLHEWLARGEQMREAQRAFVSKGAAKATALRTRTSPRNETDAADARSR